MTTARYVPGLLPVPASALPSAPPARKFFHRLAHGVAAAHRRTVEARIARFIQQSGGARLTDDLERAIERSFLSTAAWCRHHLQKAADDHHYGPSPRSVHPVGDALVAARRSEAGY